MKYSKSTSGYMFTLGGATVSWKSSKQTWIAQSTMESEFIALDECGEEVEWLCQFLEDVQKWPKPVPTICIHCDSQSAIGIAQNNIYIYIMVNLDIYIKDIIPLDNYSQLWLFLLTM